MRILIAEDDPNILRGLVELLEGEGYVPLPARDGKEALERFEREQPELVVLDVMMPGLSGYDVCRAIRRRDAAVPVLFLSAKSEEIDKVVGLELGADDYLTKPFGARELTARLRAILRRAMAARPASERARSFRMGPLEVVPAELRAHRGDTVLDLTLREVKLLETLHAHRGQVCTREMLLKTCWNLEAWVHSRTLDQHVSKLRKKIELDPKAPAIVATVHGVGYRWNG
jgi:two-component system alkaline phosphatase synthesis response regulator PhoP